MSATPNKQPAHKQAPTQPAQPAQRSVVSEETRARWRTMLTAQITSGREYDLGSLVESVVARICDEQSHAISASAKGMTAVDSVIEAVAAEVDKARAILASPGGEALKVPFSGVKIDRIETSSAPVRKGQPNSTMMRSHLQKFCKATPLESLIYTRKMLSTHLERTTKQLDELRHEHQQLDLRMKRALDERTRIVGNLALVSKELYELAKEVAASIPPQAPKAAPKPASAPAKTAQGAQAKAAGTSQAAPAAASPAGQAKTAVAGARAKA